MGYYGTENTLGGEGLQPVFLLLEILASQLRRFSIAIFDWHGASVSPGSSEIESSITCRDFPNKNAMQVLFALSLPVWSSSTACY